jgi:tRNA pseudouridine32 synthase / 23S rRNA pseudouridine746 synthase
MYGVLLVTTRTGEPQVLRAFSGLLDGQSVVAGWVPPIPGRELVSLAEQTTLSALAAINQELLTLQAIQTTNAQAHQTQAQHYEAQLQQLKCQHQQAQQVRQQQRQDLRASLSGADLTIALAILDRQSQQEGGDRRRLKQARDTALGPLAQQFDQTEQRIRALKQHRKQLSQQLQAQLYASYRLANFAGQSLALTELMANGMLPTGTGECCAPKLLHYAATHNLTPIAMAEFWWGPATGDKVPGEFYGACAERCQPLMGFLLLGLGSNCDQSHQPDRAIAELPILYQDEWLMVVDKPAGLLSVPGRSANQQDSVLTRLQQVGPAFAGHRLDQDTSGILVCARDAQTHRQVQQQFQRQQVDKVYEAIVMGVVPLAAGTIDLPLWSDPGDRPYQKVNDQHGKPSLTQFRMLEQLSDRTRVEFIPRTGRTHQLRVHAATGLGQAIMGDRLYGVPADRLYLHAKAVKMTHPRSGQPLLLQSVVPF